MTEKSNGSEKIDDQKEKDTDATPFIKESCVTTETEADRAVDYKQFGLCKRLTVDHPFRRRFIHTLWLYWSFIGLGWFIGQMGPSFPDLRLIVKQDVDTGAWLFTVMSIGYLVGSFVGGILYDKFDKLLLIAFSVTIMAVTTGALPWCESFALMLAVRFISGIGAGGLDTGGNADLVGLWDKEGRPYMQALHFCFGFGGILSPLATEPFLAKKTCVPVVGRNSNDTILNTTMSSMLRNISTTGTESLVSTTPACVEQYEEIRIHYAYLISLCVILSGAIPFYVMYVQKKCSMKERNMTADKSNADRPDKLNFRLKLMFCILLSMLFFTYCAVEDTFSGFLATFCIDYFSWSKSKSSYATSTHWGAFSLGRFSGIFLIMFFEPKKLIGGFCSMLVLAFIGLMITCLFRFEPLVWVFIAMAGFSMSVIFGGIFTWTEESILEVTGKISSMFLIASSCGLMVNPLFVGYLIKQYSASWFTYILLGESIACGILFLVVLVLVKRYVKVPSSCINMELNIDEKGEELATFT